MVIKRCQALSAHKQSYKVSGPSCSPKRIRYLSQSSVREMRGFLTTWLHMPEPCNSRQPNNSRVAALSSCPEAEDKPVVRSRQSRDITAEVRIINICGRMVAAINVGKTLHSKWHIENQKPTIPAGLVQI